MLLFNHILVHQGINEKPFFNVARLNLSYPSVFSSFANTQIDNKVDVKNGV